MKTERSDFRYARHHPLCDAQAQYYTDIITKKLCTNKQLFNLIGNLHKQYTELTKVVNGVAPDLLPENVSDVQKKMAIVWKGTDVVLKIRTKTKFVS